MTSDSVRFYSSPIDLQNTKLSSVVLLGSSSPSSLQRLVSGDFTHKNQDLAKPGIMDYGQAEDGDGLKSSHKEGSTILATSFLDHTNSSHAGSSNKRRIRANSLAKNDPAQLFRRSTRPKKSISSLSLGDSITTSQAVSKRSSDRVKKKKPETQNVLFETSSSYLFDNLPSTTCTLPSSLSNIHKSPNSIPIVYKTCLATPLPIDRPLNNSLSTILYEMETPPPLAFPCQDSRSTTSALKLKLPSRKKNGFMESAGRIRINLSSGLHSSKKPSQIILFFQSACKEDVDDNGGESLDNEMTDIVQTFISQKQKGKRAVRLQKTIRASIRDHPIVTNADAFSINNTTINSTNINRLTISGTNSNGNTINGTTVNGTTNNRIANNGDAVGNVSFPPPSPTRSDGIINNDYCSSCGGSGYFICCESCPRSFHFTCAEPPIDPDLVPDENWYCDECKFRKSINYRRTKFTPLKKHRNSKHIYKWTRPVVQNITDCWELLVERLSASNPKSFTLPKSMKKAKFGIDIKSIQLKRALANPHCAFQEDGSTTFHLPPPIINYEDDSDDEMEPGNINSKLLTRLGLCHYCGKRASFEFPSKIGLLLRCSECPLRWHMDCINPPLVSIPKGNWKCPAHIDITQHPQAARSTVILAETNDCSSSGREILDEMKIRLDFSIKSAQFRSNRRDDTEPVAISVPPNVKKAYMNVRSMPSQQVSLERYYKSHGYTDVAIETNLL